MNGRAFLRAATLLGILLIAGVGAQTVRGEDLEQGFPDPLSVEQCVAVALEHNDLLAQSEASVQSSKGAYWQSLQGVLPDLRVSASWGGQHQEEAGLSAGTFIPARDVYDGTIRFSASQTLFSLPGITSVRRGHSQLHASQRDLETTGDEIEVTARQQFYTLLAAIKLADVEQRAVELAGEQLRRAETLFRLGSVARSDVLQAQVNLAEAEQVAMNRRNAVEIETGRLAMVMGLDPRTPLSIDSTLTVPSGVLGGELDEWVSRGITERPDLQAARYRVRAADLAVTGAKAARLPRLSAYYSYRRSGTSTGREVFDSSGNVVESISPDAWLEGAVWQNSWSLGLQAELDLFSGMSIQGRIESAKGDQRLQRERLERLEKEVALEVRDAYLSVANEWENLRAAETSVTLNRENLRLQQALYESGAGTLLEWDNARLDLRRAEVSLIQAQINLLLAHVRFRKAIGE